MQKQTGQSLLWFLMPISIGLGLTHSLVPPHPGIVGAVKAIGGDQSGRVMVETILYGSALSLVLALAGWFVPGRFWAARQFVTVPEELAGATPDRHASTATFSVAVLVVTMPLWCSLLGFGVTLASDLWSLPPLLEQPIVDGDIHPAAPGDGRRRRLRPVVSLVRGPGGPRRDPPRAEARRQARVDLEREG